MRIKDGIMGISKLRNKYCEINIITEIDDYDNDTKKIISDSNSNFEILFGYFTALQYIYKQIYNNSKL